MTLSQYSASGKNSLNKEVIFVPHNKDAIVSIHNVELSLYFILVGMASVQFHIVPIIDETEAFTSRKQTLIDLLFTVWALKVHNEKNVTSFCMASPVQMYMHYMVFLYNINVNLFA